MLLSFHKTLLAYVYPSFTFQLELFLHYGSKIILMVSSILQDQSNILPNLFFHYRSLNKMTAAFFAVFAMRGVYEMVLIFRRIIAAAKVYPLLRMVLRSTPAS